MSSNNLLIINWVKHKVELFGIVLIIISIMVAYFLLSSIVNKSIVFIVLSAIIVCTFIAKKSLCLTILMSVIVYQNITVSIASEFISSKSTFQTFQGLNFLVLFLTSFLCVIELLHLNKDRTNKKLNQLLISSFFIITLMFIYSIWGLLNAPVTSVAIYFRYMSTGVFMLISGVYFGRYFSLSCVATLFTSIFLIALAATFLEVAFPKIYYNSINAPEFRSLKLGAFRDWEAVYASSWERFLNLPIKSIELQSKRFYSVVMHHVSSAYLFSFAALCFLCLRRYVWMSIFFLLIFWNGSKGPLVLFCLSFSFLLICKKLPAQTWRAMVLLGLLYVCSTLLFGIKTGDHHVIGLLGGVVGAVKSPFGHGIGVGGNLSSLGKQNETLVLEEWESSGIAGFAVESAIGALIYQMGIIGLVVLAFYLRYIYMGVTIWRKSKAKNIGIVFVFSSFIVILNSFFQEEGFSPYAMGMNFLFLGVYLSGWMFDEKSKSLNLNEMSIR